MKKRNDIVYEERMHRVCDYIHEHLDENMSVENLGNHFGYSKFHFHRQFTEYFGVSIFKFIQSLRLKRASYQLVFNKDYKIIDIGMDAGFENAESFSRAFKKKFGQTPSEFRRNPLWEPWHKQYPYQQVRRNIMLDVSIVHFEETKVAVLEHVGLVETLNHSVETFIEWRKETGLSPVQRSGSYGIVYCDPMKTKPEEFRFDIAGSVHAPIPENRQNVINKVIPKGRCAKVTHEGPYELMDEKVRYLYGEWLPQSGEKLRDFPCFFQYLNLFPDVSEKELLTEILLPIE